MVVCLVLKVDKPLLALPVYCDRHNDGARIYLIGLLLIVEKAVLLQLLSTHDSKVHQTDIPVGSSAVHVGAVRRMPCQSFSCRLC